jgi:uncharacterized repeat protein (TIGR03806 family)
MKWQFAAMAVCCLWSCNRGVRDIVDEPFPKHLSEWRLFTGELAKLQPNERVLPYDLNTPLFSDYASKSRVIWMPAGMSARYNATETFEFPERTVIAKTFSYPGRIVETRILVNTRKGWVGLPYVWNDRQTDATLEIAPDPVNIEWTHPSGDHLRFRYSIPNTNQCKGCHERARRVVPIGPKARHLNRDYSYATGVENQLVHWTSAGYLSGAPVPQKAPRNAVWNQPASGSIEQRARAYLDANCAHCHNREGPADNSGLYLSATEADPLRLGFCKVPVAAGHGAGDLRFDMVHGKPDESIMVRRMNSLEPKVMMPELGRAIVHREGVELIRQWVAGVRGDCSAGDVQHQVEH